MRKIILIIFSVLFWFSASRAIAHESCMLSPVSLEQRVAQATVIAEGKVIDQYSFFDAKQERIYTSSRVKLYKLLKGNILTNEIEIITEGGAVANQKQVLTSTLQLHKDQIGIFFCTPHVITGVSKEFKGRSFMVYASMQGFISYDLQNGSASEPFHHYERIIDARNALTSAANQNFKIVASDPSLENAERPAPKMKTTAVPAITSFSPSSSSGGTGTTITINGTNFNSPQGTGFVEFRNANDGGVTFVKPLASDYISWSNTQIVVKIPSTAVTPSGCAATGNFRVTNSDPNTGTSPTPLTINYTYTNFVDNGTAVKAKLVNDNFTGGYTFQYYTGFNSNIAARNAFERAMNSWCATQVNWIVGAPVLTNAASSDGINIVRFDIGSELPAGVLGRLTSYYTGCISGSQVSWYVTEMDVVFDDATNWQYGPAAPSFTQYDFESVALHELGHGHQLNHVINTSDVMHYALANGQSLRVLNVDDIAGGNAVMANSTTPSPCGPSAMIPLICTPLAAHLIYFRGEITPDKKAALYWTVTEEKNTTGYFIERNANGKSFENIGFVAASNLSGISEYSFTDRDFTNNAHYRLSIMNTNEETSYSNVILLRSPEAIDGISIHPNPARTSIFIRGKVKDGLLTLVKPDGRIALCYHLADGQQTIPIGNLPLGTYLYRIQTLSETVSGRLIVAD